MKTIKEGVVPPPSEKWWVGKFVKCNRCGYVGKVECNESLDVLHVAQSRGIDAKGKNHRVIQTECPTAGCGGEAMYDSLEDESTDARIVVVDGVEKTALR